MDSIRAAADYLTGVEELDFDIIPDGKVLAFALFFSFFSAVNHEEPFLKPDQITLLQKIIGNSYWY